MRNGQPLLSNPRGWIPITENINNDLSSLYLTSTQKIPINLSNTSNFNSFTKSPKLPSNYSQPQIILNSDKITINSKNDSILLTSQKSIGLISNESINMESLNMVLHTDNILKLGSKNANESVLLGNKTYDLLEKIIDSIINLSEVVSTLESFHQGINSSDASSQLISGNIIESLETIKSKILINIKSNKVKVE